VLRVNWPQALKYRGAYTRCRLSRSGNHELPSGNDRLLVGDCDCSATSERSEGCRERDKAGRCNEHEIWRRRFYKGYEILSRPTSDCVGMWVC
jgi:hypothetical protein